MIDATIDDRYGRSPPSTPKMTWKSTPLMATMDMGCQMLHSVRRALWL